MNDHSCGLFSVVIGRRMFQDDSFFVVFVDVLSMLLHDHWYKSYKLVYGEDSQISCRWGFSKTRVSFGLAVDTDPSFESKNKNIINDRFKQYVCIISSFKLHIQDVIRELTRRAHFH